MEKNTETVQIQANSKYVIKSDTGYNTVLQPFIHQVSNDRL